MTIRTLKTRLLINYSIIYTLKRRQHKRDKSVYAIDNPYCKLIFNVSAGKIDYISAYWLGGNIEFDCSLYSDDQLLIMFTRLSSILTEVIYAAEKNEYLIK